MLKTFGVNVLMSVHIASIVSPRGVSMQISNAVNLILNNFALASRLVYLLCFLKEGRQ